MIHWQNHESSASAPRPERRRFRYTLRALLVFMLCASIGLSWFATKLSQARRQREAVEVIQKLGGKANISWPLPAFLRRWLGEDLFAHVDSVDFADTGIEDDDLECLEPLVELQELTLSGTRISDAGLVHLSDLRSLWSLRLGNTKVTGPGLRHLESLPGLGYLDLHATGITDSGVQYLEQANHLTMLDLSHTQVTGSSFGHLRKMTRLSWLDLTDTPVTDGGAGHLRRCISLENLFLMHTRLTDDGLDHLAAMSSLECVGLGDIDEEDITFLQMKGVRGLNPEIPPSRITDAKVAWFRQQHPDCIINFERPGSKARSDRQ